MSISFSNIKKERPFANQPTKACLLGLTWPGSMVRTGTAQLKRTRQVDMKLPECHTKLTSH